ncbi:MAG: flavodoxin family protein [Clostridiales bacterium]|nr:flavodoxin family protein [Clostridiales bacterium]
MKTAIVYYSKHHGNTKQLVDALAEAFDGMDLIDAASTPYADLRGYEQVGFASGIYYSKFHKSVLHLAETCLPEGKPVFFLYTCGAKKQSYTDAIAQIARAKNAEILGEFGCLGFDTFGPFRLVGGIAKGHPDQEDLAGAVRFCQSISK